MKIRLKPLKTLVGSLNTRASLSCGGKQVVTTERQTWPEAEDSPASKQTLFTSAAATKKTDKNRQCSTLIQFKYSQIDITPPEKIKKKLVALVTPDDFVFFVTKKNLKLDTLVYHFNVT